MNRELVDPKVVECAHSFLLESETILWAQQSLPPPVSARIGRRAAEVFWLLVLAFVSVFSAQIVVAWFTAISWPELEVVVAAFSLAAGLSIGWLVLTSLVRRNDEQHMMHAISDRRIFSLNARTMARTSTVGMDALTGQISVEKTSANVGSLSLWHDQADEDETFLEMRRVREVDAAERLILESFFRSEQEEQNE